MKDLVETRKAGAGTARKSQEEVPAPKKSTPKSEFGKNLLVRLVPLAIFLGIWELGARSLDSISIPGPFDTFSALVDMFFTDALWSALVESNQALFIGYAAAVVVGVPMGLMMGRVRMVNAMVQGYLSIVLISPMAMIIPLIIMALGFGTMSRSLIVFVFVLPMIVVNARAGVRTVPPDLIDMTRSFGGSEAQLWRHTILPAAAPAVFTGLRIGIGRAVTGMVIAEWMLAAVGVGALLLQYRGGFQSDALFALIIVILVESLLLVQLLRFVERRVTAWAMP